MRAEFPLGQKDCGLCEFGHLFRSHEQSTVLSVHLLFTLRHPITQTDHPALRTSAMVSDSSIFLILAFMFE